MFLKGDHQDKRAVPTLLIINHYYSPPFSILPSDLKSRTSVHMSGVSSAWPLLYSVQCVYSAQYSLVATSPTPPLEEKADSG